MKQVIRKLLSLMVIFVSLGWGPVSRADQISSEYESMLYDLMEEAELLQQELMKMALGADTHSQGDDNTYSAYRGDADTNPDYDDSDERRDASKSERQHTEEARGYKKSHDEKTRNEKIRYEKIRYEKRLRALKESVQQRVKNQSADQAAKYSYRYQLADEVRKLETERRQKPREPNNRQSPGAAFYRTAEARENPGNIGLTLKEYVIDLPVQPKAAKGKKRKTVRVKMKPGVMELHRQVHSLNNMLINDVVRMTGKPLQKRKRK